MSPQNQLRVTWGDDQEDPCWAGRVYLFYVDIINICDEPAVEFSLPSTTFGFK